MSEYLGYSACLVLNIALFQESCLRSADYCYCSRLINHIIKMKWLLCAINALFWLQDDSLILPRHLSLCDIYLWDILLWVLLLWGHTSTKLKNLNY